MVRHNKIYADMIRYVDKVYGKGVEPLSRNEEREYALKAKQGDLDAWKSLISANTGLLIRTFQKYEVAAEEKGVSLTDMLSDFLVIMHHKFVKHYDIDKGSKFNSFIFNSKVNNNINWWLFRKAASGGLKFQPKWGVSFSPLPEEGNHEFGNFEEGDSCYSEKYAGYMSICRSQADLPGTADFASLNLDYSELKKVVDNMDKRLGKIINGVYFEGKNYKQVAKELKVSGEYVRILHNEAIKKLRFRVSKDVALEKRLR